MQFVKEGGDDDWSRYARPGQTFRVGRFPQSRKVTQVITKPCTRDDPGFINRVVLCELVWALESVYAYSKDTIVPILEKLLRTSQLKIEDVQAAWTAFRLYQKGKRIFRIACWEPRIGSADASGP